MGKQEENEKAYAEGKADRDAGKSDKTDRSFEEAVASAVTLGATDSLPGGPTEKEQSYRAGYHEQDEEKDNK